MLNGVIIREYEAEDKDTIIDLLRLNTPDYFSPEEEKDLLFYLDNEIEHYFVVEYGSKPVGCGGINFKENGLTGVISWDIFHPQYQGKGLGRLLLNYRLNRLKALDHIQVITVRTTQLVYKFYEKGGFTLSEIQKDYWAKGFDLYSMQYSVGSSVI